MKILALEFSSSQRSVAVLCPAAQGDEPPKSGTSGAAFTFGANEAGLFHMVTSELVESGAGSRRGLEMVDEALREAAIDRRQITCLAVGLGPGSYTGIRNAIALAQGWQLACRAKLLGVSSIEALAAQAQAERLFGTVNVVVDAQRNEFYLTRYEISENAVREIAPLKLVSLAVVREHESSGELLTGPEVTRWFPGGRLLFPRAGTLARIALGRRDFLAGENIEPIYLRETQFVKAPPPRVLPPG